MKTNITLIILALATLFSCNTTTEPITNPNDYNAYLEASDKEALELALNDKNFWEQKLSDHPDQFPYASKLGASYSHLFAQTGKIDYLISSETYLRQVVEATNYKDPGALKSLAANYISQHKFKEALELLSKAELIGDTLEGTQKMLFDVYLELGNYELAKMYLDTFKNFSDFDYLIRLSKWSDHQGNLDAAIKYMEQAMVIAESSNLPAIKKWAYTNIADFYGHAGLINKSYQHYLKALALDPHDAYAKKGIAWIAYSYEKNPEEALRILNKVTENYQAPDYYLLKAEIADYMGDTALKNTQLALYKTAVEDAAYGAMYNKYNVLLYTDEEQAIDQALAIARIEVEHRPTPESYDLLAWALFKNGNTNAALIIVNDHIINKTFEPAILYHVAEIYKATGNYAAVKPLKKELLGSLYELGPTMNQNIQQL
ncbi:tetratricopeptide repeat protein [Geojedonia litorea]|uniref:Tetratricopeptide repeat protein n=1 Tax=Geojedonia litorea TaxID=1268269 RepID=A0ABV9MYX2_9FLAO